MILTLGKLEDGGDVDLTTLVDNLCAEIDVVERLALSIARSHPEWRKIAQRAVRLYSRDLECVKASPESHETAEHLSLFLEDVTLANAASIMILFGLSHYLQWSGFGIRNPTDFEELSTQLAPFRNVIALLGFRMVFQWKTLSKASSGWLPECWRDGFTMGLGLGYLIADAHSRTPTLVAGFMRVAHWP